MEIVASPPTRHRPGAGFPLGVPLLISAAAVVALSSSCAKTPQRDNLFHGWRCAAYKTVLKIRVGAGRGIDTVTAGCAVDPALGARIEIRDPFGATRLLVFAGASGGTVVSPGTGSRAEWNMPSEVMPWGPADLWFLLSGSPPSDEMAVKERGGRRVTCTWKNGAGMIKASLDCGGVSPFSRADLKGPGRAFMSVEWTRVEAYEPVPEAFEPPAGLAEVGLDSILSGAFH